MPWPLSSDYIYYGESWVLRHSCAYTCTCGGHAQKQHYNDDTHCKCVTNYSFTYVTKWCSCEIFQSWISKLGKFLLKLKLIIWENLRLGKITHYTVFCVQQHLISGQEPVELKQHHVYAKHLIYLYLVT